LFFWWPTSPQKILAQEASVERRRTGGMTAIAVFNIVFGGLGILNGLYFFLGSFVLTSELRRLGVFEVPVGRFAFALLVFATGVVGLIAGIGVLTLRPWARSLSLGYGALLLLSRVAYFFVVPIIASLSTVDLSSFGTDDVLRLIIFSAKDVVIPVIYTPILYIVFCKSTWRTAFARVERPSAR
jgi:hypothetical protein